MRVRLHTVLVLAAVLALATAQAAPAYAILPKDLEAMQKFFTTFGKPSYQIYAPPNGPGCGAALIDTAGGPMLYAARMKKTGGGFDVVFSESLRVPEGRTPFVLMMGGRHILTYDATSLPSNDGQLHMRGTLRIRDLMDETGVPELFELRDVEDLSFETKPVGGDSILVWQPMRHFLNTPTCLPIRNRYFAIAWDPQSKKYQLRHHLETMEGTSTDDGANMNNRGIFYYMASSLTKSAECFDQASILISTNQSRVLRNHQYVGREIYELSQQAKTGGPIPFSEARQAYWQGDYAACLKALDGAKAGMIRPEELSMLVLSLAQEKRWKEVDLYTPALSAEGKALLADTLGELVFIARQQKFEEVEQRYLTALETVDQKHPAYCSGIAALLLDRANDAKGAQKVLEQYLNSPASSGRDITRPRLMLYSIYFAHGDKAGCDTLLRDASAPPLSDLGAYVDLLDFVDLSASLRDVQQEESHGIPAPTGNLDSLGFQESIN